MIHPTLARALAPFAPPSSEVHKIVSEDQAQRIDAAMHKFKQSNGYDRRADAQALTLQIERATQTGVTA